MDLSRLARSLRVIRIRNDLRQADVARLAGVSPTFVSNAERAKLRHIDLDRLDRLCRALDADLDVRVRWLGEAVDFLLDEAHAALVERIVVELRRFGWVTIIEPTFNEVGERGSVDVLAWHAATESLLVVEVKSTVGDSQATLMVLDRKVRLGRRLAVVHGWAPRTVSRLLVVGERSTNRHRIERVGVTFAIAFPSRGWSVRRWLREPAGALAGLLFLPYSSPGVATRHATGRLRVRRRRAA